MAREEFTDQEEILIPQTFTADWIHTFIKKPMLGGDLEGVQVAPPPFISLPSLLKVTHQYSRSGHGSIRCSPERSPPQSGWGFQIQRLQEEAQKHKISRTLQEQPILKVETCPSHSRKEEMEALFPTYSP